MKKHFLYSSSITCLLLLFGFMVAKAQLSEGTSWNTTGNSQLSPKFNFLGTTDFSGFNIRTNNTNRLTIGNNGNAYFNEPSSIGLTEGNKDGNINLTRGWGDWLQFRRTAGSGYWAIHNPGGQDLLNFYYSNDAGAFNFDIFTLAQDGKVRIGNTTTPGDYKLYVERGVLTEKVKISVKTSAEWADHVFQQNYNLLPLSAVERFIRQNKHLPGIPSAEQVVKEGVDVGAMQAKLLEKIEELTLYMIDLKKENEALTKRMAQLEQQQTNRSSSNK
jgi:hypothetical protein